MRDQQEAEAESVCPLPHRNEADRARKAARGARICAGHVADVDRQLLQLATFDADADEAAHDQTLSRKAAAPITGDRERPLVIAERFTDHSREADEVLRSWVKLVAEERNVHVPILSDQGATPGLCGFLRRHHSWSVSQPWADDYAGKILALGRRAWSLLHPSGKRQFTHPLMRCVEVDEELNRCPGSLWAFLTPDDPTFEAKGTLVCDACDFEVTSDRWMSYGRKVLNQEVA